MRIALVVPVFPRVSETFITRKFIGLNKAGLDAFIVCQTLNGKQFRDFNRRGGKHLHKKVIKVWPHNNKLSAAVLFPFLVLITSAAGLPRTIRYFASRWRILKWGVIKQFYLDAAVLKLSPDVIHFEFGSLAVGKAYLKDILDCRIITSFRGYDINYSGIDISDYYQEVWTHSDALHFLGTALHHKAISRGCPADLPAVIIPPAVDTEFFSPGSARLQQDKSECDLDLNILSVGRLDWVKGYEYALLAIKLIIDRGITCRYRIIGNGPFAEAVYFTRHRLRLESTVELTGARPPEFIRESLRKSHVFLQASISEGFCNAVLEAQAAGVPVVCTDAGGLKENVQDGVTGIVVPRRNPSAMAEALCNLANNTEQRRKLGKNARKRVLAHFGQQNQIKKFFELYSAVGK